jgi:hypothetical protein
MLERAVAEGGTDSTPASSEPLATSTRESPGAPIASLDRHALLVGGLARRS